MTKRVFEQRHVETLAVIGNQNVEPREVVRQRRQHGGFFCRLPEKILLQIEAARRNDADANQKGDPSPSLPPEPVVSVSRNAHRSGGTSIGFVTAKGGEDVRRDLR